MRKSIRIITLVLSFVLLFQSIAFAEFKIITPTDTSIVEGDSFNLCIKTEASKIRVSINIEQTSHIGLVEKELQLSRSDLSDAHGNPVKSIKYKVQGTIYEDFEDTKDLTIETINHFGEKLSEKEKEKTKITNRYNLSEFSTKEYLSAETYQSESGVGLFAKQYVGFKPGIYEIKIEELNAKGKVLSESKRYICIKEASAKTTEDDPIIVGTEKIDDEIENHDVEVQPEKITLRERILNFFKSIFK